MNNEFKIFTEDFNKEYSIEIKLKELYDQGFSLIQVIRSSKDQVMFILHKNEQAWLDYTKWNNEFLEFTVTNELVVNKNIGDEDNGE